MTFRVRIMVVVDSENGVTILNDGEPFGLVPGSFLETWLQQSADGKAKVSYLE